MATKIRYLSGVVEEYQLMRQTIRNVKSNIDCALRLIEVMPNETTNKCAVQYELFKALDILKEVDEEVI